MLATKPIQLNLRTPSVTLQGEIPFEREVVNKGSREVMKSSGFNASKRTEGQISIDASIADISRPNVICFLTAVNQSVEHGTHL